MGEHHEVAQYMLEQGALSITGIQDIAARENIVDQNDTKLTLEIFSFVYFVCRYTPLDNALMGEHHKVAQYMLEQRALSITGIQNIDS